MKLERIGAQHPLFDASFSLYESSFPPNERRTRADHLLACLLYTSPSPRD